MLPDGPESVPILGISLTAQLVKAGYTSAGRKSYTLAGPVEESHCDKKKYHFLATGRGGASIPLLSTKEHILRTDKQQG